MPPKKKAAAGSTAPGDKKCSSAEAVPAVASGDEDEKPAAKRSKVSVTKDKKPAPKKVTKSESKPKATREAIPEVVQSDMASVATTGSGKTWNMKFSSWNVNGIRAWVEKNGHSFITAEDPDIFCLQETKCSSDSLPGSIKKFPGYKKYWLSGDKDGYSGTALFSKQEPVKVTYGIEVEKHDKEGRVITAEYDKFYFVAAYVPNAGRGLPRLDYRTQEWDVDFRNYLMKLDKVKPVILCGDLNVAHREIDLANPKTNTRTAGFTKEEREQFSELLKCGFIDSFRHLYPDVTGAYTYWTYMSNARAKNVGWRLDYFVISERLKDALCDCVIRKDVHGSDHCPITLLLHL
jgi:AP endonuclease-1